MRSSPSRSFRVNVQEPRLRRFKGQDADVSLGIRSLWGTGGTTVTLTKIPEGLKTDLQGLPSGSWKIRANSAYSGVYSSLKVRISVVDLLGVAERYEEKELDVCLEFLPKSLLLQTAGVSVAPMILGEIPANMMGVGQEFYGPGRYNLSQDVKDILWKRLARSGLANPLVRVREANTPELLTVCVLESFERTGLEYYRWRDLVCESVARLGKAAIGIGMKFRILHVTRKQKVLAEADDLESLSDCSMAIWQGGDLSVGEGPEAASIIITGEEELTLRDAPGSLKEKPTVVFASGAPRPRGGPRSFFFSGTEELNEVVGLVLRR